MVTATNDKRYLKYDDKHLYLMVNGQVQNLGLITTLKGRLTHEQKLKAVQYVGEWIKL